GGRPPDGRRQRAFPEPHEARGRAHARALRRRPAASRQAVLAAVLRDHADLARRPRDPAQDTQAGLRHPEQAPRAVEVGLDPARGALVRGSLMAAAATAERGSNFYLGFLFLSPKKREALSAVYAYCRLIDDIVDSGNLDKEQARR